MKKEIKIVCKKCFTLSLLAVTFISCSDNSNLYLGDGLALQSSTISPTPPSPSIPNPAAPDTPGTQPYEGVIIAKYYQKKITDKVDIILSVDNSGSMQPHIEKVAKNISIFTNFLIQQNVKFRMGIVKNSEDEDGIVYPHLRGPHPIVRSTDQNIPQKIAANLQNIMASYIGGYELGVTILEQAIHLPINQALFRSDAAKVFIVLTDADDDDHSIADMPYFIDEFNRFSGEYPWLMLGIGWPSDATNDCDIENTDHELLESLAHWSGGLMGNICDSDYSAILNQAANRIYSFVRDFSLAKYSELHDAKIIKIQVFVNDQEIAENATNGFVWNAKNLTISFPGTYFPPEGAKVEVRVEYEMP